MQDYLGFINSPTKAARPSTTGQSMTDISPETSTNSAPPDSMLALTTRIVSAYIGKNPLPGTELPALIDRVFQSLAGLTIGLATVPQARPEPAVPVKKSVFADYIVCLEDGKKMKMLKRHLMTSYGMTPEAYRDRWKLPPDYPMVAPAYAERRSALAKSIGLGRKPAAAGPEASVTDQGEAPAKSCAAAASLRGPQPRVRSSAAAPRHVRPCPICLTPPALRDPPCPERGPAAHLRPPAGPCPARRHPHGQLRDGRHHLVGRLPRLRLWAAANAPRGGEQNSQLAQRAGPEQPLRVPDPGRAGTFLPQLGRRAHTLNIHYG